MTAFPHANNIDPKLIPEIGILQFFSYKWGSMNSSFCNLNFIKGTDYMGIVVGTTDSSGKKASHLFSGADNM